MFQDLGGSEVVPSRKQLEAVQGGTADLVNTAASYVGETFPEGLITHFTFGATGPEYHKIGLIKALDKIARERIGVAVIGSAGYYDFHLFLTKPIKSIHDLNGMKLRGISLYNPVLHELGVSTVRVASAETYSALQTGVIDGGAWAGLGVIQRGIAEVVKYQVYPPFWTANDMLTFVNAAWLDALPEDARDIVLKVSMRVDEAAYDLAQKDMGVEVPQVRAMGVQPIVISDEEWWEVQRISWEKGKAYFREVAPEHADELLKLVEQFYPPERVMWPTYEWR